MKKENYVIGIDYGTDSVRSLIVDAGSGEGIASCIHYYKRWGKGDFCHAEHNQFRQHPLDYIEGLEFTVKEALRKCPERVRTAVRGISIDTTGSTPCAVDRNGAPLSLLKEFKNDPDAMFILWKDHTAVEEADEINVAAKTWGGLDYTKYSGGVYSSEWFWSKILHALRKNQAVRENVFSWVEHCDWISAHITGHTDPLKMKRSICAAGHKAMWHPLFGGLPPEKFLAAVDPLLKGLREHLYQDTFTSNLPAGNLSGEWAGRLGLSTDVIVGVGAFDSHMGAVGAQIEPYILTKVMGTSTCDMLIAPIEEIGDRMIAGICGQVDGSIIPGMLGMEAGQSAFGDVYAWFKDILMWPIDHIVSSMKITDKQKFIKKIEDSIIPALEKWASALPPDNRGVVALDWLNGRRTPFADQQLKGAVCGLDLGTDAPRIYRGFVEATAFGARKIVERFVAEGVPIKGIIGLGGVSKKSPFIMQTIADVLNMPVSISAAEQACALGAAMFAATACGIHKTVEEAQKAMSSGFEKVYTPDAQNVLHYNLAYHEYSLLGDFIESRTRETRI
jgi:L-ribulokinase